ncbi:cell division protein FtsW [Breznakia sp. PF5-3]|uniref:FtsW/RodA/SpoVE family cell cycle protein n=1 Tax=unclassified Breznakia TaxID=2623764 RepID=UPI002405C2F3|nr:MULTISPECIES: FtsW/RodA/SpoVE family cell cycle protein [unclassified Breznakia]MDF9825885.1 cell division protein FtsW [Breznakia sp. PM6-1]MDF9836682.1 cell division protein FtsW [Breznakia sp. PF5-3]MDF9838958.1 cell division protein FtsW [Breznakia sp. PFB2-8]MDF9860977.1 cell division protein FtsW [Breznakia sp. PH5-24]
MDFIKDFLNTYYLVPVRFVFVLLVLLLFREIKRLMLYRQEKQKLLAVLEIEDAGIKIPVTHYEMTIGRSNACDVVINLPSISRQHAVLTMKDNGYWKITDTKSKGGVLVNGKEANEETEIKMDDEVILAGVRVKIMPSTFMDAREYEEELRRKEKKFTTRIKDKINFIGRKEGNYNKAIILLNIFQILAFIQLQLTIDEAYTTSLWIVFISIFMTPWIFKIIARMLKIQNLGAEAAAFFLTTFGFCVIASANPGDLIKQLGAYFMGIAFYSILCIVLKNVNQIMKLRRYAAGLSILLLLANLVLGSTINGQTNWIVLGPITIQPSEFVKVLFIFASSATLDWLFSTKNLRNLIVYSVACVGLLFLMGDFGTALIFFFTFIILMFMTSGDIKAILMTFIVSGLGGLMVLSFRPYIMQRFSTWRNVWAHIYDTGSQQARALIALSSGGLLGLGAGNGFARTIFAADSDIVISMIIEEWGLIIAIFIAAVYIIFMISAIRSHKVARSSYYVIAACAAAGLFVIQTSLNIFGALDVLPFTGVTLPFISNGGSSMVGSWGLLSFITAALNYAQPKKNKAATPVEFEEE